MKIKISYIVCCIDKNKSVTDPKYMALILDENKKVPFSYIDDKDEYETLKGIHVQYVNYNFDWCVKSVCGFRVLSPEEAEVTYITIVPWSDLLSGSDHVFTLLDISSQKITIEDYYGTHITRFGHNQYR